MQCRLFGRVEAESCDATYPTSPHPEVQRASNAQYILFVGFPAFPSFLCEFGGRCKVEQRPMEPKTVLLEASLILQHGFSYQHNDRLGLKARNKYPTATPSNLDRTYE